MTHLIQDLQDLIEHDQAAAHALLPGLVARMPRSVDAQLLLARAHLRALEIAPALMHYEAASTLDPGNVEILNQTGLCRVAMGHYELAFEAYKTAFERSGNSLSGVMCALMLHRLDRVQDAFNLYNELVARIRRGDRERWHLLRGMGLLLRDGGAPLAADRILQELLLEYRAAPRDVAMAFVERDNSIDFHEWNRYAHKDTLALALKGFAQENPGVLAFPETFVLPDDRAELQRFARSYNGVFIAKPHRGTGGQGISITRDSRSLAKRSDVVVQRYLDRPFLVDGLKAHMRIYGLVTSVDPFRAYIYRDGIVRFAPDVYDASESGLANSHAHVTNTALHRHHPRLNLSSDPSRDDIGHVWSLDAYLKRAATEGLNRSQVWNRLRALVLGFLGVVKRDGLFTRQAKMQSRAFPAKLFGLDVLLDAEGLPWMIEVQRKPAMGGAACATYINEKLARTVFEMSCVCALDDGLSGDRIAQLAKSRPALRLREAECEIAMRGEFEPL